MQSSIDYTSRASLTPPTMGQLSRAAERNVSQVAENQTRPKGQSGGFPEDVVTLSTGRSNTNGSGEKKKPSIAVSAAERKALLAPSYPDSTFSIYG